MRRFLTGLALLVSVFLGLSFSAPREASALRCMSWSPGFPSTCLIQAPDLPPGGHDCTGAPASGQVNIYTAPNKGGFCVTIPATMGSWNLNSSNGWYGWDYIKDIEVASSVTNGWVCSGPNLTVACYPLYSPYNYSYNNPPYSATQPGWQSIYVGP